MPLRGLRSMSSHNVLKKNCSSNLGLYIIPKGNRFMVSFFLEPLITRQSYSLVLPHPVIPTRVTSLTVSVSMISFADYISVHTRLSYDYFGLITPSNFPPNLSTLVPVFFVLILNEHKVLISFCLFYCYLYCFRFDTGYMPKVLLCNTISYKIYKMRIEAFDNVPL